MWKSTVKQLLKEFWIPALIAGGWTAFVTWESPTIEGIVTNLGPSFFLAAWATGQIFRVRKQIGVEGGLKEVSQRVSVVVERLETTTTELINYATGGASFCFAIPFFNFPAGKVSFVATHVGQHPLHVTATVASTDNHFVTTRGDTHRFLALPLGELASEQSTLRCLVGFQAPNGAWVQYLTSIKISPSEWCTATRIVKDGEVIHEEVPPNYPNIDEALWDWISEYDGSRAPRPSTAPVA